MSLIGDILTSLAQTDLPSVFGVVMPDTMDVLSETPTSDGAGGQRRTETVVYEDVPCSYERKELKRRDIQGGKTISIQEFIVEFPTHKTDGTRYSISPANRLKVLARGNEPIKIFRIISMSDDGGITFQAICTKEN